MGVTTSLVRILPACSPVVNTLPHFFVYAFTIACVTSQTEKNRLSELLAQWVQLDPARRSVRQISLATGMSQNALSGIIAAGSATAESLRKIADALNQPVVDALIAAGILTPDEVRGDLSEDEDRLRRAYRLLTPEYQKLLHEVAAGFHEPAGPEPGSSLAVS